MHLGIKRRADVWLDLSNKPVGTTINLKNETFPLEVIMGQGGMMMESGESTLPQGSEYPVLTVQAASSGNNEYTLTRQLVRSDYIDPSTGQNLNNPRQFVFAMDHMKCVINGRTLETTGVADEETVKLGSTEVWELINGGGMNGRDDSVGMMDGRGMMGNDGGMMNGGVMLGNMMRMPHPVIMRFENFPGLFLYHCHNLEHEDMGMMRNFKIT